ncbi:MAG: glycoside hydrolase domain-containing protein [Phycisphaerae bacterium]
MLTKTVLHAFVLFAAVGLLVSRAPAQGTGAGEANKEEIILDFEQGGKVAFDGADKLEYVADHATQGKTAGKITVAKDKPFAMFCDLRNGRNLGDKWGKFDRFIMDVFVEGGPVKVYAFIRDTQGNDWDNRYNQEFVVQPGKRQVEIAMGAIIRQKNQKPMDLANLTSLSFSFKPADDTKPATIYLDNARLVKGAGSFEVKVLYSFEGDDKGKYVLEDWPEEFKGKSKVSVVEEHATAGKKALKLESNAPAGNVQFTPDVQDWSGYDTLAFDVFNASDKPLPVGGWLKAKAADAYNDRSDWQRVLRPGANVLKLPVGGLVDNKRKPFAVSHIEMFNISVPNATVFIDNIRLVKGVEEIAVEGIRKFDFGPAGGAVMPGFTCVSRDSAYDKTKGFGWLAGGDFFRDFDIREVLNRHRPFDNLVRDFGNPIKATFAVDVPNGEYKGWLMLAPPGAGVWHSTFRHRTVSAQGKVIHDQEYNAESFKKWEFQWQDTEDMPGDDLWERYVNPSFRPVLFDAAVTDGQIKLDFDGHGEAWSVMVCGLVIWPKASDAQAQKWLANLNDLRKEQYLAMHVEAAPPASAPLKEIADAQKANGFVRFIHSPDRGIEYNSAPTADEVAAAGIELSAAPGEYQDGCFGIYPLKDRGSPTATVGKLTAYIGDLAGPGGAKIAAANLDLQIVRYKAMNHDATYTVQPKYMDKLPADGVAINTNVTRSFWLIAHVPADAAPGKYTGNITIEVMASDKSSPVKDIIPVTLTVWPIKLAEIDMPMGMYMVHPPYSYLGLETSQESYWKEWKNIIEDCRAHGMTSFDPAIGMPLKEIKDGKAVIDFANMDKWMELAKAAGFTKEIHAYAVGTGFSLRPAGFDDPKTLGGAARFGLASYGELVKLYFEAYKEHAKAKGYLPMNFCDDDEYLIHAGNGPEYLARYAQVLKDNAPGISFVPVDSMYPDEKPEMVPVWEKMLKSMDSWGAGLHSPKLAEMVKKAGCRLILYNTGLDRFTFGTYMFYAEKKYDVKGFWQWIYHSGGTMTDFDLASHRESWYGVVYPSSRGIRTTPVWERIRAGCNDHRYLQTAWELIAAAKASGKNVEAAKALETLIEGTFAKLKFGKGRVDPAAAEGKADNPMAPAQQEAFRRALAEGIMKLTERTSPPPR